MHQISRVSGGPNSRVAQVHHHEQVGVGGNPAALASHGEVKFIQFF